MDIGSFLLARGLVGVVIGIIAFTWPGVTVAALIGIFAFYALVEGIMNFALGFGRQPGEDRPWGHLLQGVLGILAGILMFVWPSSIALVLIYFIGSWAILTGIFGVVAAVRLRKLISGEWLLAFGGVLSIVFGVIVIAVPGVGVVGLSWSLGAYAVISGLVLIALGMRLRGVKSRRQVASRA